VLCPCLGLLWPCGAMPCSGLGMLCLFLGMVHPCLGMLCVLSVSSMW
jgi:hypothetical protein